MNLELVTFANSRSQWCHAGKRLRRQAIRTGWFSDVRLFDETFIQDLYPKLWTSICRNTDSRGFGYWRWKPALVLEMAKSSKADFVMYLDAGCELNSSQQAGGRLTEYLDYASARNILLMRQETSIDRWCKSETLEFLQVSPEAAPQIPMLTASFVLIRTSGDLSILEEWLESAYVAEGLLFDDRWDASKQVSGFRDHRHDQAVLSIHVHHSGLQTIADETYFDDDWCGLGSKFPVWAMRNRFGFSAQPQSLSGRTMRFVRKVTRARSHLKAALE